MPITPEKKALYPKNWESEIVPRILARAGNACEKCGVPNRAVGYRDKDGTFVQLADCKENAGMEVETASLDGYKVIQIVLTTAHWPDSDPANVVDGNLWSLCQRCHNRLDMPMRRANAQETRRSRMAVGSLFQEVTA